MKSRKQPRLASVRHSFVTIGARDLCGVYGGAFDQERYRKEIAECDAAEATATK
jgi:hypothetical protein